MKFYACMDALLDEMEEFVREHYGYNSASWRSGDFAAGALLEFKGRHGDGRLHNWTVGDVREFLLDWFPRTVLADEDLERDVPECAAVFFRFMTARGTLTGDSLSELEGECARLRGEFLSSCQDSRRWDPAKVRLSRILPGPQDHPPRQPSPDGPRRRSTSPRSASRSGWSAARAIAQRVEESGHLRNAR
jgi:hypothetical protein